MNGGALGEIPPHPPVTGQPERSLPKQANGSHRHAEFPQGRRTEARREDGTEGSRQVEVRRRRPRYHHVSSPTYLPRRRCPRRKGSFQMIHRSFHKQIYFSLKGSGWLDRDNKIKKKTLFPLNDWLKYSTDCELLKVIIVRWVIKGLCETCGTFMSLFLL